MCFFFFKQKTAYEMRISDWSSDVCSSDLSHARVIRNFHLVTLERKRANAHAIYRKHQINGDQAKPERGKPARRSEVTSDEFDEKIGRASCRERVCQYV